METIQKIKILKWVCIIFFTMQRSVLGYANNRVLTQKDEGTYAPDDLGFGLGWSWGGVPSLGIGPGSGNIAFGSKGGDIESSGGQIINGGPGYDTPGSSFGGGGGGFGGNGNPAFGFHFGGGSKGNDGKEGSRGIAGGGRYFGSKGSDSVRSDGRVSNHNRGSDTPGFSFGGNGNLGFHFGGSRKGDGGKGGSKGVAGGGGYFGSEGSDSGSSDGRVSNGDRGYDTPGFSFGGGFGGFGGYDNPAFGFHFGGGSKGNGGKAGNRIVGGSSDDGYYWGSRGPGGCFCDCRGGGKGNRQKVRKPSTWNVTCRPVGCLNDSNCGGYSKKADGRSLYWCKVPRRGTLPFWCTGGGELSGQSLNCEPINCPKAGACGGNGAHFVLDIPIWDYDNGRKNNRAGEPREVDKSNAAKTEHN